MAKKERIAGWSLFGFKKKQVIEYIENVRNQSEAEIRRNKDYINRLTERVRALEKELAEKENLSPELERLNSPAAISTDDFNTTSSVSVNNVEKPVQSASGELPDKPEEDKIPTLEQPVHESSEAQPAPERVDNPEKPICFDLDDLDLNDAGELVSRRVENAIEMLNVETRADITPKGDEELCLEAPLAAVPTFPKIQDANEGNGPDWRDMLHRAYEDEPSAPAGNSSELSLKEAEELREINRSLGIG